MSVAVSGEPVALLFDPDAFDPALLLPFREMRRLQLSASRAEFFWSTARSLEAELDRSRYAAAAYATLLLVEVGRMVPQEASDPIVDAVVAVISARFAEELSLRDVAAELGLTPGHLTTVVRQRTGRTVQQWITEYRLTEARRLLADPTLTVAAVARRVGMRDPAYFTRVFHREVGIAPRAWRVSARSRESLPNGETAV